MADLYTSLVRAKEELNGGALPVMTPIPEDAQSVIDPRFTIGLGALMEDPEKGLRCPVRGCGRFFHRLTTHLNNSHPDAGGAVGVCRLLSIPVSTPLASKRLSSKHRETCLRTRAQGKLSTPRSAASRRALACKRNLAKRRKGFAEYQRSMATRNFKNTCDAQLRSRLLAVYDKIGRSPSYNEGLLLDPSLVRAAERVYGTWNNFKAMVGLDAAPRGSGGGRNALSAAQVTEAFRAWFAEHGSLPSSDQVNKRLTPIVPTYRATCRALGVKSWDEAMRVVASLLDVRGGRYGIDSSKRSAA